MVSVPDIVCLSAPVLKLPDAEKLVPSASFPVQDMLPEHATAFMLNAQDSLTLPASSLEGPFNIFGVRFGHTELVLLFVTDLTFASSSALNGHWDVPPASSSEQPRPRHSNPAAASTNGSFRDNMSSSSFRDNVSSPGGVRRIEDATPHVRGAYAVSA